MMNGGIVEPVSVVGSSLPLNMPINSFGPSDLPELPASVFDNLQAAGYCTPTLLERSAVPVGLAGRDMVIVAGDHDEGQPSSLVISLVAPLVNQMLRAGAKKSSKVEGSNGDAKCCPQGLLIAPTRKLLNEAARLAAMLTAGTPLEFAMVCGGAGTEAQTPSQSARLLLATPGRLSELLERSSVSLERVSVVAIEEINSLVDLGFEPHLRRFLGGGGSSESGCIPPTHERQTLVTATSLPEPLNGFVAQLTRADAVRLQCAHEWRAACVNEHVLQSALFTEAHSKQAVLAELVAAALDADRKLLVVVASNRRSCDVLSYYLQAEGLEIVSVHASNLKPREREAAAQRFVSGKARVLVATDAALKTLELHARGAAVSHVINFDVCTSREDYLERLTYVGRAGHSGRLTTLVGDEDAQSNPGALAELVELLRASSNDVPRWLEGLILQQAPP